MTRTIDRVAAQKALTALTSATVGMANALVAKVATLPEHEQNAIMAGLSDGARRRTEVDHESGSCVVYFDGAEFLRVPIDELTPASGVGLVSV